MYFRRRIHRLPSPLVHRHRSVDLVTHLVSKLREWSSRIELRDDPELAGVSWEIRAAAEDIRDADADVRIRQRNQRRQEST